LVVFVLDRLRKSAHGQIKSALPQRLTRNSVGDEVAAADRLGEVLRTADKRDGIEDAVDRPADEAFPPNRAAERHQRNRGADPGHRAGETSRRLAAGIPAQLLSHRHAWVRSKHHSEPTSSSRQDGLLNGIITFHTRREEPHMSDDDDLKAELERLKAENERLKSQRGRSTGLKVSEKGGVSVYGLGRFPVTLYKEQWAKLLGMADEIRAFIKEHESELKTKPEG